MQLFSKMENRVFFVDEGFENHEFMYEAESFICIDPLLV